MDSVINIKIPFFRSNIPENNDKKKRRRRRNLPSAKFSSNDNVFSNCSSAFAISSRSPLLYVMGSNNSFVRLLSATILLKILK